MNNTYVFKLATQTQIDASQLRNGTDRAAADESDLLSNEGCMGGHMNNPHLSWIKLTTTHFIHFLNVWGLLTRGGDYQFSEVADPGESGHIEITHQHIVRDSLRDDLWWPTLTSQRSFLSGAAMLLESSTVSFSAPLPEARWRWVSAESSAGSGSFVKYQKLHRLIPQETIYIYIYM